MIKSRACSFSMMLAWQPFMVLWLMPSRTAMALGGVVRIGNRGDLQAHILLRQ